MLSPECRQKGENRPRAATRGGAAGSGAPIGDVAASHGCRQPRRDQERRRAERAAVFFMVASSPVVRPTSAGSCGSSARFAVEIARADFTTRSAPASAGKSRARAERDNLKNSPGRAHRPLSSKSFLYLSNHVAPAYLHGHPGRPAAGLGRRCVDAECGGGQSHFGLDAPRLVICVTTRRNAT